MDISELEMLQGIEPSELDWSGAGLTRAQYGGCLGNAMSANVLEAILPRALYMARIIGRRQYTAVVSSTVDG